MNELPDTLSGLLRVAVKDMRACLADPQYIVRMDVWYEPGYAATEVCAVCMAGCVLAQTCGFKTLHLHGFALPEPEDELPRVLQNKLRAINYMRLGSFINALADLGGITIHSFSDHMYGALQVVSDFVHKALPSEEADEPSLVHSGHFYAPLETYEVAANFLEELGL